MFEKAKMKREQQIREEQEELEQAIRTERERLMTLSDKELMVEAIIALKMINYTNRGISDQCEIIRRTIVINH